MHNWIISNHGYIFSDVFELIHFSFKICKANLEFLRNFRYDLGFIIIQKYYYNFSWGLKVNSRIWSLAFSASLSLGDWWNHVRLHNCNECNRRMASRSLLKLSGTRHPKSKEKSKALLLSWLVGRHNIFQNWDLSEVEKYFHFQKIFFWKIKQWKKNTYKKKSPLVCFILQNNITFITESSKLPEYFFFKWKDQSLTHFVFHPGIYSKNNSETVFGRTAK